MLWQALQLPPNAKVGIIGGGGKTSILFQLAQEARNLGYPLALTTTTRMYFPSQHLDWLSPQRLEEASPEPGKTSFLFKSQSEEGKVVGISPNQLDRLVSLDSTSAYLYEADGSRGRPVKIHGSQEPVLADCTTHSIVVFGLSAWGQTLSPAIAHRLEVLEEMAGQPVDLELAEGLIVRMLARARGIPLVILNQAARPELGTAAQSLAARLAHQVRVVVREHAAVLAVHPAGILDASGFGQ